MWFFVGCSFKCLILNRFQKEVDFVKVLIYSKSVLEYFIYNNYNTENNLYYLQKKLSSLKLTKKVTKV